MQGYQNEFKEEEKAIKEAALGTTVTFYQQIVTGRNMKVAGDIAGCQQFLTTLNV